MDITNLTSLINALRAETQEDSITPESLGALLQNIVNVLGSAASDLTVQQLVQWQQVVRRCTQLIAAIQQGSDDANNLLLKLQVANPSTGDTTQQQIVLKQATMSRAGIMRAQHVSDLSWCRSKIQDITDLLESFQESLTTTSNAATQAESTALEVRQRVMTLSNDCQQMQEQVNTIANNVDAIVPLHLISLEVVREFLYVRGDLNALTEEGLVPYIFRYSTKQHRIRPRKNYQRRHGPRRKGWHIFYDADKIKVDSIGEVKIKSHREDFTKGEYFKYPDFLFGLPTFREDYEDNIVLVHLPFGKYMYDIMAHPRKFKFGIAYGLPVEEGDDFKMTLLRTNMATIKVRVYYDFDLCDVVFHWSR